MKIKQYLIAIIEDDEDDRDILAASFRENHDNAAVIDFIDGVAFIDYLRTGGTLPDLIVTDLYMPRMNGLELILKIKTDELLKAMPVVLLSTITNETVLSEVVELAGVYYFVKPIGLLDYVILSEKIMHLLPRH